MPRQDTTLRHPEETRERAKRQESGPAHGRIGEQEGIASLHEHLDGSRHLIGVCRAGDVVRRGSRLCQRLRAADDLRVWEAGFVRSRDQHGSAIPRSYICEGDQDVELHAHEA